MSFRGRYPTRFRRSGGFKKSFANEKEITFKRKFHEERGGTSFKRPRGASSFHRNDSNLVHYQAEYDRGRGQWNSRRPRGRNLRSPRSRYIRGRGSYYETRGRQPRQRFERTESRECFEEEEEFDSGRPFFNQRSPRLDYDEEEEIGGFDESLNTRAISPLQITKTFSENGSLERYSRDRSFERRSISPLTTEHYEQERILHGYRSRSRSFRSRSLEKYDYKMRDGMSPAERSSPLFRENSRNFRGSNREGSFDRRYSPNRNYRHSLDKESRHESVERNNYSRSLERLYERRNTSPHSTSSNRFQRHENDEIFHRRNDLPYLDVSPRHRRSGSEASYHSSLRDYEGRNIHFQGNSSFQNDSSSMRQNFSPRRRRRSEERMIDSPPRLEGHVMGDFERRGSPFELNYYQRPVYERNSPTRVFPSDRDEIYSKRSFSHENDDQNLRRNDTGYFVERQRMKRVFNDERRRGHEKRSESSIERFLNDCKKSVYRRPDSSRVSSPRDSSRGYDFDVQQYRSHSSQRKFRGPDQIVIERGRSFERSQTPNTNNTYQNSKNVLGSPTEWGNGKKEIVSQIKESSPDITVPDLKHTSEKDNEIKINEPEKSKKPVVTQPTCDSKIYPLEDSEEKKETDGGSDLNKKDLEVVKNCKDLNLSPISQHENFEAKDPSPSKETKNINFDLSPISQSSSGFKDSPNKSVKPNDENIGLSPISQHENFDQTEIVNNLDLSPISQPGSFEKREFSHETDHLSGLSPISQNSLIREKDSKNEKKISKSSESCDSMQEFLKELERSCERSRSVSESSFECQMKMPSNRNKELDLSSKTSKSNPQKNSRDPDQSQYSWKRQPELQTTTNNEHEFQNTPKYASKITFTYQDHKGPRGEQNYYNEESTSTHKFKSSTGSIWKVQDRNNLSKSIMNQTGETSSQELSKMGPYPSNQNYNSLEISDYNQNQLTMHNVYPLYQVPVVQEPVILDSNTQDLQRRKKDINPSQNQHVLHVLGPKNESKYGQLMISGSSNLSCSSTNPTNQTSQFRSMQNFGQPFNQFTLSNAVSNMPNQISNFPIPFNQNAPYSQNIQTDITSGQNVFGQNNFVNIPSQNTQIGQWNLATQNVPFASGGTMLNFNAPPDLNQLYNPSGMGLSLTSNLSYGSQSNLNNNFPMLNNQNSQYSSGTQNANLTSVMQTPLQTTSFPNSHSTMNQTIPSSQNLTGSFSKHTTGSQLGTSNPSYKNVAMLKSKPLKAPTVVNIKKCLSGTFGENYLSLLNHAIPEVISISDDEEAEGSNCYGSQPQNFISLNPTLLDQYKNNPPSAEEMANILEGFVIFFDVKTNSDLEKDPFVVIHESFAKSNKFGNLQTEETNLYVDFLPVPKKVCVLRWQGLMLARAEGYTLEEARRKASISLINALAQNFYTVQTKYSYYCGGKLPKFMMKTKEQPGVYKLVKRDEIIKAVTGVLKELKQNRVYTGKGVDATSIKVVLDFIDNFFKDKSNFCELLFGGKLSFDYTLEDLKQISNHVKRVAWLQWRSISGYGRGMFTAVSRVKTPQQLCRYLLANGGETARYKLLPPQGPWIELLTADAQYHPAIVKSISKKPETPQELSRRNNQITGGHGTGWGKRGTWM